VTRSSRCYPLVSVLDEVLTDVAKRIAPWAQGIMSGVDMNSPKRDAISADAKELQELVERMAENDAFSEHLQEVVRRVESKRVDILAGAIFWFLMGWKAADERLRRITEGVAS
jgi:uncharacterized protein YgfB (UPF0149 family)